jgi:RimJ/RimL family protein N-acetyltransferase
MIHIETERLILRDWKDEDRPLFASMNADPMVMEYFPRHLDEKASNRLVDNLIQNIKKRGYAPFALEVKKTSQFIGFVGLTDVAIDVNFKPAVEIAWRLDYAAWGNGFATEAAKAVLKHGFDTVKLKEIVAYAVHDNTRAIQIMEKIGMKRDPKGDFIYPKLKPDHPLGKFVLYRARKDGAKK